VSEPSPFRIEETSLATAASLVELLGAHTSGCACRYWFFEGDNNYWIGRCSLEPERNRAELEAELAQPSLGPGLVAVAHLEAAPQVVGWLRLAPAASVPKLYARRPYRGMPSLKRDSAGVFAVVCVFVHPDWRGRGVARELIRAVPEAVGRRGGHAAEAFPRQGAPLTPETLQHGPYSAFVSAGFVPLDTSIPAYPVLRWQR
jgi:GNAT superfamily N-acetyltransferase